MELNILLLLLLFVVSLEFFIFSKKADDFFEDCFWPLFGGCIVSFLFLLLFDNLNISSKFGLDISKSIVPQNWLNLFGDFILCLLSTLCSGIILIYVTIKQINMTNETNVKISKSDKRINNMPLMKYSFGNEVVDKPIQLSTIYDKKGSKKCVVSFDIENIGMNTAKKVLLGNSR